MKKSRKYFKNMPCPLCGSSGSRRRYPVNKAYANEMSGIDITEVDIGVDECVKCGHQFVQPSPQPQFLKAFYSSYMSEAKDGFYMERASEVITPGFRSRYGKWLDRVREALKTQSPVLLDVGTGLGMFLRLAKEKGFEVAGVEPNREAATELENRYGISVHCCLLEDLSTKEKYDAVTMLDIIEHMSDPRKAIDIVNGVLKPGGLLLIEVPVRDSFIHWAVKGVYRATLSRVKRPILQVYGVHHLQYFSSRSIKVFLEENGFKVVMCGYDESDVKALCKRPGRGVFSMAKTLAYNSAMRGAFLAAKTVGKQNKLLIIGRKES